MLLRLYKWYINKCRYYTVKDKIAKHEYKQQHSTSNSNYFFIPFNPMAYIGYYMGSFFGKALGKTIRVGIRGSLIGKGYKIGWILLINRIGGILHEIVQSVLFLFFMPIVMFAPLLHTHILARRDMKKIKKLWNSDMQDSSDILPLAYNSVSHPQPDVETEAVRVLRTGFQETPGKVIKYLSFSPQEVANTLVSRMTETNSELILDYLICLKWLSRDYGETLIPHVREIGEHLDADDSTIQAQAAITFGNIGATDSDRLKKYPKLLTGCVKDPDAEVRHAAAIALGNLPCDRSIKMLEYLTNDSDPDVQAEAQNCLKKVRSVQA